MVSVLLAMPRAPPGGRPDPGGRGDRPASCPRWSTPMAGGQSLISATARSSSGVALPKPKKSRYTGICSNSSAAGLDDHVLAVVQRLPHEAETRRQLLGRQRLLLDHQAPLTVCGPGGKALGDEVGDAGRLGGGQQVVRSLRAQPD